MAVSHILLWSLWNRQVRQDSNNREHIPKFKCSIMCSLAAFNATVNTAGVNAFNKTRQKCFEKNESFLKWATTGKKRHSWELWENAVKSGQVLPPVHKLCYRCVTRSNQKIIFPAFQADISYKSWLCDGNLQRRVTWYTYSQKLLFLQGNVWMRSSAWSSNANPFLLESLSGL